MAEEKAISAVVISYNGIDFIADCLQTLKDDLQDFTHEIIVVDNGSNDGTREFLEENHGDIRLIRNSHNAGFARAVNQGVKASRYPFLWVLNQDIKIQKGCLASLLQCHSRLEAPGIIGPRFVGFDGQLQHCCRRLPQYRYIWFEMTGLAYGFPRSGYFNGWKMGDFDHLSSQPVEQPMGAAMLISRKVLNRIGLMDESFPIFLNDVDLCRRILETGHVNYYCVEAVIWHFIGGSTSRRKAAMIWHSHISMFRYFRKWEKWRKSVTGKIVFFPLLYLTGAGLTLTAALRSVYHLIRSFI